MKITSIRMADSDEEALNNLALDLGCYTSSGSASWRMMLQMIARGMLRVTNPSKREAYINFKKHPHWWRPDSDNAMPAAFVAGKYKAQISELVEKGFLPMPGDRLAATWKGWQPNSWKGKPSKRESWWSPSHDSAMPVESAVAASGLTVEQLAAGGLVHDEELGLILCPDEWKGWKYRKADAVAAEAPAPEPQNVPAMGAADTNTPIAR